MYVSRLTFRTLPGKTGEVEQGLRRLEAMVTRAGGTNARILHTHFASLGAPDVVFEQEAPDLAALEAQIGQVAKGRAFKQWSASMSSLLAESPKREMYIVV